jgi:hypothetical protein
MKTHIKPSKHLQQLIVIFGVFMMLPTVTLAQQNTREQIEGRITFIDDEIKKLTYEKEAISIEFKYLSDFSQLARPHLSRYNQFSEAIKLKQEERPSFFAPLEAREQYEAELKTLMATRDYYTTHFRNSGGVTSCFKVQCNTIEELQNEYTRSVEYYKDKKREYDNIALELGNLNNKRHNLTAELNYMGGDFGRIFDLIGCWNLRTGKYISQIGVYSSYDKTYFYGLLEVNNLENYKVGQTMFRVSRVDGRTFRGKEFTYYVDNNGKTNQKAIPVKITINSDGNFLTWTSDETVTMQRCN